MAKETPNDAEINARRSRFVWTADQIVILKNPDQETKSEPAPSAPKNPDPAEPKPIKDDR